METEQSTILDVLQGEESVKVAHQFDVNPRAIWTVAASVAATMLTVYIIRAVID